MNNDNFNKENVKKTICSFMPKAQAKYMAFNRIPIDYFSNFLNSDSRIKSLLKHDAIALLINAAILALIGIFFTGLISEIAIILSFLNIISILISYIAEFKE